MYPERTGSWCPHSKRNLMNNSRSLAEAVRRACLDAALQAHEDAGLRGLCQEGRWECALESIRGLDLDAILNSPRMQDAQSKEGERSLSGHGRG
jgi:hypothetical protein